VELAAPKGERSFRRVTNLLATERLGDHLMDELVQVVRALKFGREARHHKDHGLGIVLGHLQRERSAVEFLHSLVVVGDEYSDYSCFLPLKRLPNMPYRRQNAWQGRANCRASRPFDRQPARADSALTEGITICVNDFRRDW
jgi:hypothetical protein